jgi:hypothetical protein
MSAWESFACHAREILSRPRFDEGYRDWKHRLADDVRTLLVSERDTDRWLAGLGLIVPAQFDFRDYRLDLPTARQTNWLKRWARFDADSLWTTLDRFVETAGDPVERFAVFSNAAEKAPDEVRVHPSGVMVMGSLLNFALAPESLPIIRPTPFAWAEEALGVELKPGASPAELYETHLDFAVRAREHLEAAGLPIRDMIDVQSLIFVAGHERDYWGRAEPEEVRVARERTMPAGGALPYLSVCAIYRNEAKDLREWIEFHRLIGVERFFLYDNRSTDDHLDVLAPYIESGVVVHHDWPLFPGQFEAYDHCMAEHRNESRWIALLDVDEFLFSPTGAKVSDLLVEFEQHPSVGVNQLMFGSSGHRTRPPGLVVSEHTRRDRLPWPYIKNIVDPVRYVRSISAHLCAFSHRLAVDENHQPILGGGRTQFASVSRLRINHYYFKSAEEGRAKIVRPMAIGGVRPYDFDELDSELSAETDKSILQYLPELTEALARPSNEVRRTLGSGASP